MSQLNSENTDKYKMMSLQKDPHKYYDLPTHLNINNSEEFKEITEGTQHGWLASQHETDHEPENPGTTSFKHPIEEFKSMPEVLDTINDVFQTPTERDKEEEDSIENAPFVFKREFESVFNRKSVDTIPEITSKPSQIKRIPQQKLGYKSIIAITAAIILQNYWRDYKRRRMQRVSDPD